VADHHERRAEHRAAIGDRLAKERLHLGLVQCNLRSRVGSHCPSPLESARRGSAPASLPRVPGIKRLSFVETTDITRPTVRRILRLYSTETTAYNTQNYCADSVRCCSNPFSTTHAAICVREAKPSLPRILVTCDSTVRSLTINSSAMARLDLPV